MVSRLPATQPPKLSPPRLRGLAVGESADLQPGADLEGTSYAGLELSELDLGHGRVTDCSFDDVSAESADLEGTRLRSCRLDRVSIPSLRSSRSDWRDVAVTDSRLGSAELYESGLRSVEITGCRLGFVNLRGARVQDVVLRDCVVDELDLSHATVLRMSLPGTRVARLVAQGASLEHVDLRKLQLSEVAGVEQLGGATIDDEQLQLLAPLMAAYIGLKVEPG